MFQCIGSCLSDWYDLYVISPTNKRGLVKSEKVVRWGKLKTSEIKRLAITFARTRAFSIRRVGFSVSSRIFPSCQRLCVPTILCYFYVYLLHSITTLCSLADNQHCCRLPVVATPCRLPAHFSNPSQGLAMGRVPLGTAGWLTGRTMPVRKMQIASGGMKWMKWMGAEWWNEWMSEWLLLWAVSSKPDI